jgi:flagellar basal-body rod modification protein FlgD
MVHGIYDQLNKAQLDTEDSVLSPYAKSRKSAEANLDKKDFLTLLVAEIQHQNPLDPKDGSEFVGQLVQFGTYDGINGLDKRLERLGGSLDQSGRAAQATSLVGREVTLPIDRISYTGKNVEGMLHLPMTMTDVTVEIRNKQGVLIRSIHNAEALSGDQGFVWDGTNAQGILAAQGEYKILAHGKTQSNTGELQLDIPISVTDIVQSVSEGAEPFSLSVKLAKLGQVQFENNGTSYRGKPVRLGAIPSNDLKNDALYQSLHHLGNTLNSSTALQATALVGRMVETQSDKIQWNPDVNDSVKLRASIPEGVNNIQIQIKDMQGEVMDTRIFPQVASGEFEYEWDGMVNEDMRVLAGLYQVSISENSGGIQRPLDVFTQHRVNSVSLNRANSSMQVNLEGLGPISLSQISKVIN